MSVRATVRFVFAVGMTIGASAPSWAADQPVAIFHAFDQYFSDIAGYVCELPKQGYSHVQIPPAQKSNPSTIWYARYQPVDYSVIEGRGSEDDLRALVNKAHGCGMKVIADVVFNHMADMPEYKNLDFPGISHINFHKWCKIVYNDGNRDSEVNCWLGDSLPDLDQSKPAVQDAHKKHLRKLLSLGIDGFRFDAAKHMPADTVRDYIDFVNQESHDNAWNYLEVIEGGDTRATDYAWVAAVTNFDLYYAMHDHFNPGGNLVALRERLASDPTLSDHLAVSFGRNHDNLSEINTNALTPYSDRTDSYLATALVLAREHGTPLILNWDNYDSSFIRYGVMFRKTITQRARSGAFTKENFLAVIEGDKARSVMMMERGGEGFFVVNKDKDVFDVGGLDLTLTNLEGCYRELRGNFSVAIERRGGKKYLTRWGTWRRGGMQVYGREALFFVRDPWERCTSP
jgi:alpha-amylase